MKWPLGNNRGNEETEEPADPEKKMAIKKTKNKLFAIIRVACLVCHA